MIATKLKPLNLLMRITKMPSSRALPKLPSLPKSPKLKKPLPLCHLERSRSACDDAVERSRGCVSQVCCVREFLPGSLRLESNPGICCQSRPLLAIQL